ncbi:Uncharacterised protein [Yersinia intermedia]|nr:Uncharacterised protein [Yersinia intermedia]CNG99892.1 Uncharacterised protein [Yersinia intermedia]
MRANSNSTGSSPGTTSAGSCPCRLSDPRKNPMSRIAAAASTKPQPGGTPRTGRNSRSRPTMLGTSLLRFRPGSCRTSERACSGSQAATAACVAENTHTRPRACSTTGSPATRASARAETAPSLPRAATAGSHSSSAGSPADARPRAGCGRTSPRPYRSTPVAVARAAVTGRAACPSQQRCSSSFRSTRSS